MRILYLTLNPNLVSTTRILQSWLLQGRDTGLDPHISVRQSGDFATWLHEQDLPFKINPMPWPDRRRPVASLFHAARLAFWARRRDIDLIHCNEHNTYPFAVALSRLTGLPVVCHVRCKIESGFADWTFGKREPDALIWCTPQMRDECGPAASKTTRPERQYVIPLGIDLSTFGRQRECREILRKEWGINPTEVVVGMASALRPGKRIEDFLELARRIRERTSAVFVLAGGSVPGDESYYVKIRPQIEAEVARGTIRWLGHLHAVEPFLQAIDVFVSTSEHESFGMSVCEAMACQKPAAAYAACSVAEVIGSTGLVVETGDLEGLTTAVEKLVKDAALRSALGAKACERVATEFNPSQSLNRLTQIYANLIVDRRSRR